jgi:hypothetical protein
MRHRRSSIRWVCATVAPWALGAGLLVSFTAVASNDPQTGISAAAIMPAGEIAPPSTPVPPSTALAASSLRLPRLGLGAMVKDVGAGFAVPEAEAPPRADVKPGAGPYASMERAHKSDPLETFRPSLSRRGADFRHGPAPAVSQLVFGRDESILPPTVLTPVEDWQLDPESVHVFEPYGPSQATTTQRASSVQSPVAAAAGSTGAARGPRNTDGATPAVSRAVAL